MAIKSIRKEIRNLALTSVAVSLLLTVTFGAFYKIKQERNDAFLEFNTLAKITALNSQSALLFHDKQVSAETLNALAPREDIADAAIFTKNGEVLARVVFARQDVTQTKLHKASKLAARFFESVSGIGPTLNIEQPVALNGKLLGKVRLTADTSLIWDGILISFVASIGAMLLALLLSILLVRRMIERIMMPISRLSESASNIASTRQYSQRVIKTTDDELGMMTDQFNLMLNEVEKRDQELSMQTVLLEDEVKSRTNTIKKSMEEMQSLLNSMGEGAYGVDTEGNCTFVNMAFLKILGYTDATELIGKPIHELIQHSYLDGKPYPVTEGKVCDAYRRSLSIHRVNEVFWRKNQVPVPVEYWSQPILIDEVVQGAIVTFIDITERNLSENSLRIAATAFETQEGMMITDASNVILRVNKAFTEITGFTTKDVIGKTPRILRSDRQDESFYTAMWARINHAGAWEGELWNKRKNGAIFPQRLTITAVKNENGIVINYVATLTDITLSRAAAAEIENLAFYDSLTQLPNRRLLLDRIKQALAYSARNGKDGAVLFLDLDHFKTLNDTLGHDVGDILLKQVAERLTASVREGDTVARLGGDEFVVLLEDLSELAIEAAEQAETIGEKILSALNQPYKLGKHEYQTTPSIGVVLFSNHGESQDSLLKHADIAMYQSKKLGRNRLSFFDPHMQDAINTRVDMERELRKALEKQQFQLYYQMQVNSLGQALGAEVLIRWIHPERGMISPLHFIPLAEDTELIIPIGQWVLESACAQLERWQQTEHTKALTLSVNVSAKQFRQTDFVMQVQATLQRYAIDPSLLKLELTESMLLDDIEGMITTMTVLKTLGIRFSLDDFGTGYSSLQYLKKLPLYQLKIDQSFVRDIATDSSDRALVLTIITMAHSLELNVIAEGVETEEQREFLIENGCQDYQGYLFAKPMPVDEFEVLLKAK